MTYWETRISKKEGGSGGLLSTTSNGKFIGPEVPFGYVMGSYHEEPVLLIESSMGNRSLSFDFRPPSSGKTEKEKGNKFCGFEYTAMVEGVQRPLGTSTRSFPTTRAGVTRSPDSSGSRGTRTRTFPGRATRSTWST
ncbi:MAG: hypothetical protein CM1200mP2_29580 [Planctomycetaceae bacterium]|nr:MAG: hypothetical protein CM1200mP2_29580 [Planctomycetaceae bacterium]